MEIFGIKFAPLKVPIERRLQTLAVLFWVTCFLFYGLAGVVLFFILLKYYTWFALLYAAWYWYDFNTCHQGGRRHSWYRNWIAWRYMRDYFPAKLTKTAELDPTKNYIAGCHPHGVLALGSVLSFTTEATGFSKLFPNIKPYPLTLNINFRFPFYRDFIMSSGVCSVSKESINWILNREGTGNMAVIGVGGAREALDANPGHVKLTLLNRKGFIKLAVQNGANLIPVFVFGENELYKQLSNKEGSALRKFQNFIVKCFRFSPPFFHGRGIFQYTFGIIPYRIPIDVVVGKPIDVTKTNNPSEEIIDHYHELYMKCLKDLFDERKKNYDFYKNVDLEFI